MQNNRDTASFDDLPLEMKLKVFSFLRPEDFPAIARVNTQSNRLNHDNHLWQEKFQRHFPHIYKLFKNKENRDWLAEYQHRYKDEYKDIPAAVRELFSLIKEGDLQRLQSVNFEFSALDFKDKNGYTLLKWAQIKNHQNILDFIFSQIIKHYSRGGKLRPNFQDKEGRNLLHWAILCNQSGKVVEALLKKGCNPKATMKDENRKGVIHLACEEGRLEIIKVLLKKKPDLLHKKDFLGRTPVMCAAACGQDHIVSDLAKRGAKLNQQSTKLRHDPRGFSPLHWAVLNGHKKVVEVLLESNAQLTLPDFSTAGLQAIHHACEAGQLDIVELLIQKQRNLLDQVDRLRQTPVVWAASRGHAQIVSYLAEQGADLNLRSGGFIGETSGYSPLHWAAEKGYTKVVEALIENNARLDQVDDRGIQAIHLACEKGHFEIVKLLLQKQPNLLDQVDRLGQTPAVWAASRGHAQIVSYLAERGADLDLRSGGFIGETSGYSPLHWAAEKGYTKVAEALIENNAGLDQVNDRGLQAIHLACEKGHFEIVKLLLQKQSNLLNQVDLLGQTPVLWAASRGHAHIVNYLADQGADLNLESNSGNTPLHWAAKRGHVKTIRVLLKKGADVQKFNRKGETPADLAKAHTVYKNQLGLIEYCKEINYFADNYYKTSFSFLGRQYNFGCSAKEKKAAANALNSVVFEGADKSCLEAHQKALNNGTLHSIYRRVK